MEKTNGDNILRGWAQIERYLGITRKTVLARKFPIRKKGGVWALRGELLEHLKNFPEITNYSR